MRNGLPNHVPVKLFSNKGMGEDKREGLGGGRRENRVSPGNPD